MRIVQNRSLVGRRGFLALLPFAFVPAAARAHDGEPKKLTSEQMERLFKRLAGKWRSVHAKSAFLVGGPPENPISYIYSVAPNGGMTYTTENGPSVQMYDGKPYDAEPTIPGHTLSRVVLDEYTVDNIVTNKKTGKRSAHSTLMVSPDGTVINYIGRTISDSGEESPRSFQIFEKVPNTTLLWWEAAKR